MPSSRGKMTVSEKARKLESLANRLVPTGDVFNDHAKADDVLLEAMEVLCNNGSYRNELEEIVRRYRELRPRFGYDHSVILERNGQVH